MSVIIPFLSRGDESTKAAWLSALRAAMPAYDFIAFDDLSPEQKVAAQVAVVVDPDPAEIAALPNLIWGQSLWAGVERLMGELPASHPIQVVRLIDPTLSETMAEAVLAWTLYLSRNMPQYARLQSGRVWQQLPYKSACDTKVGILGLGQLGTAAAKRLQANGFDVFGWARSLVTIQGISTFNGEDGLSSMLAKVDILVALLPLTPDTRGLLDAEKLGQLKRGASVINFARGPIIPIADLLAKLDEGHLAHAVLDVFDTEPLLTANPLWTHPNVTILPHISAPTNKATASTIVAGNLARFFVNGALPATVNRALGY